MSYSIVCPRCGEVIHVSGEHQMSFDAWKERMTRLLSQMTCRDIEAVLGMVESLSEKKG